MCWNIFSKEITVWSLHLYIIFLAQVVNKFLKVYSYLFIFLEVNLKKKTKNKKKCESNFSFKFFNFQFFSSWMRCADEIFVFKFYFNPAKCIFYSPHKNSLYFILLRAKKRQMIVMIRKLKNPYNNNKNKQSKFMLSNIYLYK